MPAVIGYARTSTNDQIAGLEAQQRDLLAAGCADVIAERVSSVADCREGLARVLTMLGKGDTLMVTKPDRLARSTLNLLEIVRDLDAKGANLIVLSMGGERLDTRNPTSKLMLTILAGVATWEREIMLERQRDGIAKARSDGKYKPVGSRSPMAQHIVDSVHALVAENKSTDQIMDALGLKRDTVLRAKRKPKANETGQFQPISLSSAA